MAFILIINDGPPYCGFGSEPALRRTAAPVRRPRQRYIAAPDWRILCGVPKERKFEPTFDMAHFVKRRHGFFSRAHEHGLRTGMSVTPNGERDAWGMAATM